MAVNVFFPEHLVCESPKLLVGRVDNTGKRICITGSSESYPDAQRAKDTAKSLPKKQNVKVSQLPGCSIDTKQNVRDSQSRHPSVFGTISLINDTAYRTQHNKDVAFHIIIYNNNNKYPRIECHLSKSNYNHTGKDRDPKASFAISNKQNVMGCVLISYDMSKVMKSLYFMEGDTARFNTLNGTCPHKNRSGDHDNGDNTHGNGHSIHSNGEYSHSNSDNTIETNNFSNLGFLVDTVKRDCVDGNLGLNRPIVCDSFDVIYAKLISFPMFCCTKLFKWSLFSIPSTCGQIGLRIGDLYHARKDTTSTTLRKRNSLYRQLFDTLLGLLVMWLFIHADGPNIATHHIMWWANVVVVELKRLLTWMMGTPAGLKMNHQLDQFLGKLFLEHINFWAEYLLILNPFLREVLWYISLCGVFGISFQLTLIQDLLSMMTLHIYCFYVYAAKLYCIEYHGLKALWRLFRGKKWNKLRERVDSADFDVDQLFIGALLFTALLFLLPTVGLYYIVFTGLRLLVLLVQGMLSLLISCVNNLPVYFVYLRVFDYNVMADDILLEPAPPHRGHYIYLQLKPASFTTLLKDSSLTKSTLKDTEAGFGRLLSNIIQGYLIYPWISNTDSNT